MTPLRFTLLADTRCEVAEGPVYDERTNRLYFVDIKGRRLGAIELAGGALSWREFGSDVCSLGLAASGRLIVALRDAIVLLDAESGEPRQLCRVDMARPEMRLNDGKVGPDGAFWVGSMDTREAPEPLGALYRVDASGEVAKKAESAHVSNGLAWTADGEVMFYADSRGPWVDCWDFDRWSGEISRRRRFAEPSDIGRPDGGACDAEGCYWSAGVSAGRLNRFDATGGLMASYETPAPAPTMPCFGGPDFSTLFLTSLRPAQRPEALAAAPHSGGVFVADAPVSGFAAWRFLDV
jgi:sugar lactone lactonase YvrE